MLASGDTGSRRRAATRNPTSSRRWYHLHMRYLFGLILSSSFSPPAARIVVAGRQGGPSIEIAKPEKFVGMSTPLEVAIGAPAANLKTIKIVFEQNGKQTTLFTPATPVAGEGVKLDGAGQAPHHAHGWQADGPRSQDRPGPHPGHGVAAGHARPAHARVHRDARRQGAARTPAGLDRLVASTTSIWAAPRWWCIARCRQMSTSGVRRRRRRVSRLSRPRRVNSRRREARRSRASDRIFFPAVRSGPEDAHPAVRTG